MKGHRDMLILTLELVNGKDFSVLTIMSALGRAGIKHIFMSPFTEEISMVSLDKSKCCQHLFFLAS